MSVIPKQSILPDMSLPRSGPSRAGSLTNFQSSAWAVAAGAAGVVAADRAARGWWLRTRCRSRWWLRHLDLILLLVITRCFTKHAASTLPSTMQRKRWAWSDARLLFPERFPAGTWARPIRLVSIKTASPVGQPATSHRLCVAARAARHCVDRADSPVQRRDPPRACGCQEVQAVTAIG